MNQVPPPMSTGRFIGRVIVGVLIAEAVWGVILSLTRNLIVPYLTQVMGGTPQAAQPVINVPDIFGTVIALCLAGIIAVILNAMLNRPDRSGKVMSATAVSAAPLSITPTQPSTPVASPPPIPKPVPKPIPPPSPTTVTTAPIELPVSAPRPAPAPIVPQPTSMAAQPAAAKPAPAPVPSAPATTKPAPTAAPTPPPKPAKPKPPREIQYNIVGEPISPMDEDD